MDLTKYRIDLYTLVGVEGDVKLAINCDAGRVDWLLSILVGVLGPDYARGRGIEAKVKLIGLSVVWISSWKAMRSQQSIATRDASTSCCLCWQEC
jgi:hypothetical protein